MEFPEYEDLGRYTWKILHTLADNYPCEPCRNFFSMAIGGIHDMVNVHLGRPVFDKKNLRNFIETVKTVEKDFKSGRLSQEERKEVSDFLKDFSDRIHNCPKCRKNSIAATTFLDAEKAGERLNITSGESLYGDRMVTVSPRTTAIVYIAAHGAKLLQRGFEEVDKNQVATGKPVEQRPSTWLNLGLAIALPIVVSFTKLVKNATLQVGLITAGAVFSTKLQDYAEEAMGRQGYRAYRPMGQRIPAVPTPVSQLDTLVPRGPVIVY